MSNLIRAQIDATQSELLALGSNPYGTGVVAYKDGAGRAMVIGKDASSEVAFSFARSDGTILNMGLDKDGKATYPDKVGPMDGALLCGGINSKSYQFVRGMFQYVIAAVEEGKGRVVRVSHVSDATIYKEYEIHGSFENTQAPAVETANSKTVDVSIKGPPLLMIAYEVKACSTLYPLGYTYFVMDPVLVPYVDGPNAVIATIDKAGNVTAYQYGGRKTQTGGAQWVDGGVVNHQSTQRSYSRVKGFSLLGYGPGTNAVTFIYESREYQDEYNRTLEWQVPQYNGYKASDQSWTYFSKTGTYSASGRFQPAYTVSGVYDVSVVLGLKDSLYSYRDGIGSRDTKSNWDYATLESKVMRYVIPDPVYDVDTGSWVFLEASEEIMTVGASTNNDHREQRYFASASSGVSYKIDQKYYDVLSYAGVVNPVVSVKDVDFQSYVVTQKGGVFVVPFLQYKYFGPYDRFTRSCVIKSTTSSFSELAPNTWALAFTYPTLKVRVQDLIQRASIEVVGAIIESNNVVEQEDTEATLYDGVPKELSSSAMSNTNASSMRSRLMTVQKNNPDGSYATIIPTLADPTLSWAIVVSATGAVAYNGPDKFEKIL